MIALIRVMNCNLVLLKCNVLGHPSGTENRHTMPDVGCNGFDSEHFATKAAGHKQQWANEKW